MPFSMEEKYKQDAYCICKEEFAGGSTEVPTSMSSLTYMFTLELMDQIN